MPELINPQHEQFARLLAGGAAKVNAYAQVYPTASRRTARDKGCRLAQRQDVEDRIVELLEAGAEEAIWTLAQRLEYLQVVAATSHAQMDEKNPICQGVKQTALGVEYKMPDKLGAVSLYTKLAGDLQPDAGMGRDLLAEMMGAIRSGAWVRGAPVKKKLGRVLDNARHERFAQLVGSGERLAYAYEKVYEVRRLTATVEGHRLAQQPLVAARIREIRQVGSSEVGWTRGQRLRYLRDLAETPIDEISEESCYCQGVRRSRYGTEIKVPDKVKAVALYSALAVIHQKKKGITIEEIAAGMRSRGNEVMADGTERSLLRFAFATVG